MSDHDEERRAEILAEMLSRDPGDPERERWERDPAHRALVRAHESFLRAEREGVPDEDREQARRRMEAGLDEQLGPGTVRIPAPRSRWAGTPRVLALAAALALIVGGIALVREALEPPSGPTGRARGEAATTAADDGVLREDLGDGRVRLRWPASERAERYEIVFLGSGLEEVARVRSENPSVILEPATLDARWRWWSVEILRQGDVVRTLGPYPWSGS